MDSFEKSVSIGLSGLSLLRTCLVGASLTGISAGLSTIPVVNALQHIAFRIIYPSGRNVYYKKIYEGDVPLHVYSVTGGLPAVAIDLVTKALASTDFEMERPLFEQTRVAYMESTILAQDAFGEYGYCRDQWDRFGVILEAMEPVRSPKIQLKIRKSN